MECGKGMKISKMQAETKKWVRNGEEEKGVEGSLYVQVVLQTVQHKPKKVVDTNAKR